MISTKSGDEEVKHKFLKELRKAGKILLIDAAITVAILQGMVSGSGYYFGHIKAGEGTYYQGQLSTESDELPERSIKDLSENEFDLDYLVGIHDVLNQAELDYDEKLTATGYVKEKLVDSIEELEVIANKVLPSSAIFALISLSNNVARPSLLYFSEKSSLLVILNRLVITI